MTEDEEGSDMETKGKPGVGGGGVGKNGTRKSRAISEPDENDPLGLIRREIAVMKKLE